MKKKIDYRIRRLTPWESFILMGTPRENVDKCMAMGNSESTLCTQAGNGIVSPCVHLLAEHMYMILHDKNYICIDEKERKEQGLE